MAEPESSQGSPDRIELRYSGGGTAENQLQMQKSDEDDSNDDEVRQILSQRGAVAEKVLVAPCIATTDVGSQEVCTDQEDTTQVVFVSDSADLVLQHVIHDVRIDAADETVALVSKDGTFDQGQVVVYAEMVDEVLQPEDTEQETAINQSDIKENFTAASSRKDENDDDVLMETEGKLEKKEEETSEEETENQSGENYEEGGKKDKEKYVRTVRVVRRSGRVSDAPQSKTRRSFRAAKRSRISSESDPPVTVKKEVIEDMEPAAGANMQEEVFLSVSAENADSRHSRYVLRQACHLLHESRFLDVTLHCDGMSLKAHRLVLTAYSAYFNTLLSQDQDSHSYVTLDSNKVSGTSLKALVEFMYCGKFTDTAYLLPFEELLEAAKSLGITKAITTMDKFKKDWVLASETQVTDTSIVDTPKRKRGRPRKNPLPETKVESPEVQMPNEESEEASDKMVLRELKNNDHVPYQSEDDAGGDELDDAAMDEEDEEEASVKPRRVYVTKMKRKLRIKRQKTALKEGGERKKREKKVKAIRLDSGAYKCMECEFVCNNDRSMHRHYIVKHTEERPYVCQVCAKSFKLRKYLNQHLVIHSDERPYACDICSATFRASKHRDRHLKTHDEHKDFLCEECGKAFGSANQCESHYLSVHKGVRPYKCTHEGCTYSATDPYLLKRHGLKHTMPQSILCEVCGKEFSCAMSLKHHVNSVHGDASYPCTECQYKSNTKYGLISHMARIHNKTMDGKPASRTFQCDQCAFSCFTRQEFNLHELKHKGEKPHVCPVCSFATAEKGSLTKHLRLHTGEKPYQCDLCPMKFSHPAGIARHRIQHTGIKPYPCKICGKGYMKKASLEAHMASHTNIKPFSCHMCNYGCLKKELLNNHLGREHGIWKPKSEMALSRYKRRMISADDKVSCQFVPILPESSSSPPPPQPAPQHKASEHGGRLYANMEVAEMVQESEAASLSLSNSEQHYRAVAVTNETGQTLCYALDQPGYYQAGEEAQTLYNMNRGVEFHSLIQTHK